MNTLVIVLIAAVCLIAGYTFYGSWLAKKWGIDPKAKTPAVAKNDGQDYVPTDGWTVFAHQFSSIAGAGPVTGAIQAAVFGWVPVLLWILIGGIFFGAVTDFGALYASVKNEGKSMGLLIEKYIGKTGKKLFLLFCWLFTLIVIAAFADMVAGTFNASERTGCNRKDFSLCHIRAQLIVGSGLQAVECDIARCNISLKGTVCYFDRKASCHDHLVFHLTGCQLL
jgi:carbon starvation protein